jgi:hypothetical protein
LATSWLDGQQAYDERALTEFPQRFGLAPPPGVYYPPGAGFVALPFGLIREYAVSRSMWWGVLVLAVLLGTRWVVRLAAPFSHRSAWLLAGGLVLLSAANRWAMTGLNAVPLVFALLAAFLVALRAERPWLAAALALATTLLKPSLALPFFGLLLLHRHHRQWLTVLAVSALVNAVGFARLGGLSALRAYRGQMATLEALDKLNTPNPWAPWSVPRSDLKYLVYGLTHDLHTAELMALGLALFGGAWLLALYARAPRELSLSDDVTALLPLLCLVLLVSYHHQYDLLLLFVPALFIAFERSLWHGIRPVAWSFVPLGALITLLPIGFVHARLESVLGGDAVGVLNMTFSLFTLLALVSSFALLRGLAREWQGRPSRLSLPGVTQRP